MAQKFTEQCEISGLVETSGEWSQFINRLDGRWSQLKIEMVRSCLYQNVYKFWMCKNVERGAKTLRCKNSYLNGPKVQIQTKLLKNDQKLKLNEVSLQQVSREFLNKSHFMNRTIRTVSKLDRRHTQRVHSLRFADFSKAILTSWRSISALTTSSSNHSSGSVVNGYPN